MGRIRGKELELGCCLYKIRGEGQHTYAQASNTNAVAGHQPKNGKKGILWSQQEHSTFGDGETRQRH